MDKRLVKKVLFPIHEMIMGRKTYEYLHELEDQQWWAPRDLETLRMEKLKALLIHAKTNIPFYGKWFADAGFDPTTMGGLKDFRKLPILTKADIRKNIETMKWKQSPGGLTRYNTGGSSGEPLVFFFDRRRQAMDAAARALTHQWWGVDIGERELYLWGSPLEITKQDKIKDLRDLITNQLLISAFEISEAALPAMVARFRKFNPNCLFGYPSTIDLFCRMARKKGFRMDDLSVKVVFSTAEVLFPHQKEFISTFFGNIPVVDAYGSREGGFIAHQCREGAYHVMDPNYVIEYLKDGEPVAESEDGEIVITHLDAWGMPFVRYRTGDIARPGAHGCKCGRGLSIISGIRGRTTDFVVTPDGRWQHALSVIYVVRDIEGVAEFKIVQNDVDDVSVLLKVHEDIYPENGHERIVKGFKKRMGDSVNVKIEMADEIPRDASGKYRYVVSKVAEKGFH